jgi:hypothetical protein
MHIRASTEGETSIRPFAADCAEFDDLWNPMMDEFEAEHDNSAVGRTVGESWICIRCTIPKACKIKEYRTYKR